MSGPDTPWPLPKVGDPAPDIDLPTADGKTWRLADHAGHHVVVIFHRHIHWLPCGSHVIAVRDRLADFGADTAIALVMFNDLASGAEYAHAKDLPFPVLLDRDRATYRAYGFGRGSVRRVWGLRAAQRYLQIVRTDGITGLRRPTEDTLQLGGNLVVAPDGTISYLFRGRGPDDRPTVDELVAALA